MLTINDDFWITFLSSYFLAMYSLGHRQTVPKPSNVFSVPVHNVMLGLLDKQLKPAFFSYFKEFCSPSMFQLFQTYCKHFYEQATHLEMYNTKGVIHISAEARWRGGVWAKGQSRNMMVEAYYACFRPVIPLFRPVN